MKILPLALLAVLVACRSTDGDHGSKHDGDHEHDAATMEVETAELPEIRYYMIADT